MLIKKNIKKMNEVAFIEPLLDAILHKCFHFA